MAIALNQLIAEADHVLDAARFNDYCPNGLQVEGRPYVSKIVSGVTASQALVDAAIEAEADVLLVHHGYFWKGENPCITGMKQRRLKALLDHDISLVAYHLPLDVHAELGNNVQLAKLMDWSVESGLEPDNPRSVGLVGAPAQVQTPQELAEQISRALGREPLLIAGSQPIRRLAWCTGAAQGYIEKALAAGVDAFITGEVSEPTVHFARENDITFIAAGHHATERYGVQALGDYLARHFAIAHQFIDCANPV